jgi:RHS repeat-associated protein
MDLNNDGSADFDAGDLAVAEVGNWDEVPVGGARELWSYYHSDLLGAATHVTDSVGTLVSLQQRYPYGTQSFSRGLKPIIGFAGNEEGLERELGLIHMGAREYAPELNRWLSPDPLFLQNPAKAVESPLEMGLYAYALNNPVAFRDSSGLCIDCPPVGNIPAGPMWKGTKPNITQSDVDRGLSDAGKHVRAAWTSYKQWVDDVDREMYGDRVFQDRENAKRQLGIIDTVLGAAGAIKAIGKKAWGWGKRFLGGADEGAEIGARQLARSAGDAFEDSVKETFKKKIINQNEILRDETGRVIGEIDFETSEAIVEVGISLKDKLPQLHKLAEVAAARAKRLDVVYGPRTSSGTVKAFKESLRKKHGNRVRFLPHE